MAKHEMKTLAKQTAIYGMSSVVGKFLNWLLVPLYTYVLQSSGDYGVVTNLYAWTALLLVILTYGMETGLFRFANKQGEDPGRVYGTALSSVSVSSAVFVGCVMWLAEPLSRAMGYGEHPEFIRIMGVVVAMDAVGAIPFAFLRYQGRAVKFAVLKLSMIAVNIAFNLFFLVACPWIADHHKELIDWFYDPSYGVGYVFVSNLISTSMVSLALVPEIRRVKLHFSVELLGRMLRYSLPLLVLGVAGIMNQTVDKMIFPFFFDDKSVAQAQLGIYGACFKVAVVMMMFTQAFRYAYEPFIFGKHARGDNEQSMAEAMKYFVIFSLLVFLGVVFYLEVLQYLIRSDYRPGLRVVPVVLFSYIFQGVFFNLSIWYKLSDKTYYGARLSLLGVAVNLAVNVAFVPRYGYMACAWASLASYALITVVSYVLGQKHLPIRYDLSGMGLYVVAALALYAVSLGLRPPGMGGRLALNTLLLAAFAALTLWREAPLRAMLKRKERQRE